MQYRFNMGIIMHIFSPDMHSCCCTHLNTESDRSSYGLHTQSLHQLGVNVRLSVLESYRNCQKLTHSDTGNLWWEWLSEAVPPSDKH